MRLLLVVALVALASSPAARAETIRLGWRESDGAGVMSFRVQTLTLTP